MRRRSGSRRRRVGARCEEKSGGRNGNCLGSLGKMASISSGFYGSRRRRLFLLKGKSHGHGRVGTTT